MIELVTWRRLEIPLEFARICLQRDYRVGVEIIAGANVCVHVWPWITSAPENEIRLWIVGACHPSWSAACFPGIAEPCVIVRVVFACGCPEAPAQLSRVHIIGIDKAANTGFATAHADQHHVFY